MSHGTNGPRTALRLVRFDLTQALRNRGIVIWVMVFPIVLASIFMVMFDGYESGEAATDIHVGLVIDGSAGTTRLADALKEATEGTSEGAASAGAADAAPLDITTYMDERDAAAAADAGEVCAYVLLREGERPRMVVPAREAGGIEQAIVQLVLDRIEQVSETLAIVAEQDPAALARPGVARVLAASLAGDDVISERIAVLRTQSSEFTRYYYAMLGFSSLMGAQVALLLVVSKRADGSPAGMRRQVCATGPLAQLASGLIASWIVVFGCLVISLAFIRLVAKVSLGGREGLAVLACAACALVSCAIGTLVGAVPHVPTGAKDVALTVLTMGLSLPAGLFGTPAQHLGDWLSLHLPWVQLVNPAVQVGEAFYRLTFYDSLAPFAASLATLAAMSAVCFAVAALLMRRQRHASL